MGYLLQIEIEFKDKQVPQEFATLSELETLINDYVQKSKLNYDVSLYNYKKDNTYIVSFELYCDGRRQHFDWEIEQLRNILRLYKDKIAEINSSSYTDIDNYIDLDQLYDYE